MTATLAAVLVEQGTLHGAGGFQRARSCGVVSARWALPDCSAQSAPRGPSGRGLDARRARPSGRWASVGAVTAGTHAPCGTPR
ncbi:MAG TPA: hypothetical protein VIW28_03665, partial [Gemmatimonadales bacterium]